MKILRVVWWEELLKVNETGVCLLV
jgi:hypothetical protein